MIGILTVRNSVCEMSYIILNFCPESRWNKFFYFDLIINGRPLRGAILALRADFLLALDYSLEALQNTHMSMPN
jgi:hypothetical protein